MKPSSIFALCCLLSLGLSHNLAAQTFNDADWIALQFGTDNTVFSLAVSSNTLYAGGTLTAGGGVAAKHVAQWNGTAWSPLGSGMDQQVMALAILGTNLYAGGFFTNAGGTAANYIAQWNGTSWSPVGSGMDNVVYALAVSGTNLYAGGEFTTAGGVTASRVAKWDGSSWSALSTGVGPFNFCIVHSLAVSGTNLYVGGDFSSAGGMTASNIAKWNGTSWSALGSGSIGQFPTVYSLAVSGANVYAGGTFTNMGGMTANAIAVWNGSSWSTVGGGMAGSDPGFMLVSPLVNTLTFSGANLYAGGNFNTAGGVLVSNVAVWDGSSWSALGSGIFGSGNFSPVVYALTVSANNLFVGGAFSAAGKNQAFNVAEALLNGRPTILTTDGHFGLTNGGSAFGFNVSGNTGEALVIQSSSNHSAWTPLQTNVLTGPTWYFTDTSVTNFTRQYYRARLLP